MRTLIDFAMREEYSRVKALGDDLSDINSLINWDRFRFLEPLIYKNKTSRGGRPNIDIVIMVKALVLQSWFGLSDPVNAGIKLSNYGGIKLSSST